MENEATITELHVEEHPSMMDEKTKAVFASLPPLKLKHPAKFGEIKDQWGQGPAQVVAAAQLSRKSVVEIMMAWWTKAGVADFCLGHLVFGASRPSRPPQTEEQRVTNAKKRLRRHVYTSPIPELKAVITVAGQRIDEAPPGTGASLAQLDAREPDPDALFADFLKRIDDQVLVEYQPAAPATEGDDGFSFQHAAD